MAKIHELLRAAQEDIGFIPKSHENKAQKYSFRSVEDALNHAGPILRKHGITCVPRVMQHQTFAHQGSDKIRFQAAVLMEMDFIADDDSKVTVSMAGEGLDFGGDKATSKSLSQAFKYCIFLGLQVPLEEGALDDSDRDYPQRQQQPHTPPGGDVSPFSRAMSCIRNAMSEADLAKYGRLVDQRMAEGGISAEEFQQLEAATNARRQDLRGKTLDRESLARHCKRLGCPDDQRDQWIDKAQVATHAVKFLEAKPWNSDDDTEALIAEIRSAGSEFEVDEIYDRACGPDSTLSEVARSLILAERNKAKEALAPKSKANGKRKQSQLLETGPNTGN
jgi:hypothetical protein